MHRALNAGRCIPQIDQSAAAIKGSPCPRRPVAAVVARAPAPAMRANALQALIRAQIESQDSFLMAAKAEVDVLDDDVIDIKEEVR